MSYGSTTSAQGATPSTSPSSSYPMKIGFSTPASCVVSTIDDFSAVSMSRSSSQSSNCGYASFGSALYSAASTKPTAYVSDEDLFGDDGDAYLSEPPPAPRSAEAWLAKPLLPPVHAVQPRRSSTATSSSSSKQRRRSSAAAKRAMNS